ncbi:MAG: hypothetical protein RR197_02770, partial [Oscillospiraceae bacterium]
MKRKVLLCLAAATLLAVSSLLSGCSACSRDLESSVPAPISGSMPPVSSHAAPPAPPDSEP